MEKTIAHNTFCSSSQIIPVGKSSSVQVLYLGDKGRLTYAGSGRTVSKKLSDKLGISKFNFF